MRFLVFVIMLALLPIRGFAGDVMATEMAMQAVAGISGQAVNHALSADHQHHESGEMACADQVALEFCHSAESHSELCQNCQACHTVALSPTVVMESRVFAPALLPHVDAARFASADAALGQKPPIS